MSDPKMKFLVVDDFSTMRRIVRYYRCAQECEELSREERQQHREGRGPQQEARREQVGQEAPRQDVVRHPRVELHSLHHRLLEPEHHEIALEHMRHRHVAVASGVHQVDLVRQRDPLAGVRRAIDQFARLGAQALVRHGRTLPNSRWADRRSPPIPQPPSPQRSWIQSSTCWSGSRSSLASGQRRAIS